MTVSPRLPSVLATPAKWLAIPKNGQPVRQNTIIALHKQFYAATKNPIWFLVQHLFHRDFGNRLLLSEHLLRANVSSREYLSWKDIVLEKDLTRSLKSLFLRKHLTPVDGLPSQDPVSPRSVVMTPPPIRFPVPSIAEWALPEWLVLHLISNRIKSQACAGALASFMLWQAPHIGTDLLRPAAILTAYQLVTRALQPSLGNIIQTFTQDSGFEHSRLYFNLLLQVLAFFPHKSPSLPKYVETVLNTMKERQLTISSESYGSLFESKFIDLNLVQILEAQMGLDFHQPTQRQLESLLHFYTSHNYNEEATRILETIREVRATGSGAVPHPITPDTDTEGPNQLTRHNLIYIKALRSTEDAADQIQKNLQFIDQEDSTGFSDRLNAMRQRQVHSRNHRVGNVDEAMIQPTFALFVKRRRSAEEIVSALNRILEAGHMSSFRRRALYTIAIAALFRYKEYTAARSLFQKFLTESPEHLDARLLRFGIIMETIVGEPREAFNLMLSHGTRIPDVPLLDSTKHIDIRFVNGFLSALHRIGRNDLLFALWEKMGSELNLSPNGSTLTILLKVARRISCGPGRISPQGTPIQSTWRNMPAWKVARQIFRKMIFESYPNLRPLDSGISSWSPLNIGQNTASTVECNYPFPVSQIAFKAYIHLLASASRGEEIPRVVEWMHQLQIPFTWETIALATIGWEEHNSSSRGVMGTAGHGERFLEWLRISDIEVQGRWPTEHDMMLVRRKLFFEKRPPPSSNGAYHSWPWSK